MECRLLPQGAGSASRTYVMHHNFSMHVLRPCYWCALKHTSQVHNINASTTGCLMYKHLLEGVVVESDTMSTLSVDSHSVMICQLGCSLSAQYVSSAVLCQLGCNMSAQLNCNVSAQLQSVSSAAMCRLRCTLSAQLPLVDSTVSCKLSAQLSAAPCQLSLEFVRSAATCQLSCNWSAHYSIGSAAVCQLNCSLSAWLWFVASAAVSCIFQGDQIVYALFSWQIRLQIAHWENVLHPRRCANQTLSLRASILWSSMEFLNHWAVEWQVSQTLGNQYLVCHIWIGYQGDSTGSRVPANTLMFPRVPNKQACDAQSSERQT